MHVTYVHIPILTLNWEIFAFVPGAHLFEKQTERQDPAAALVLLPGFGVGTFHFEAVMQELVTLDPDAPVYALGAQARACISSPSLTEQYLCDVCGIWRELESHSAK